MGLDCPRNVGSDEQAAAHGQDNVRLGQRQVAGPVGVVEATDGQGIILWYGALSLRRGDDRGVERPGQFQEFVGQVRLAGPAAGPDYRAAGLEQQLGRLADL